MDETTEKVSPSQNDAKVPESPKPMAFTIDFDEGKTIDTQRFKTLVEKYQNRHRRGQSLSKFEESPSAAPVKKHPLTGNLPRKSSFHSEGYFSSDEKGEKLKYPARSTVLNTVISKGDLTLPLRNVASDRMTQSFPSRNFDLPSINSPEIELKDVSSPELDLISPISPLTDPHNSKLKLNSTSLVSQACRVQKLAKQLSSPECETRDVPSSDFDADKADTVSDAGTYTLDAENYTEDQLARMSIDKDFAIEQVSGSRKTQEYVQSLRLGPVSPQEPPDFLKNTLDLSKKTPDLPKKTPDLSKKTPDFPKIPDLSKKTFEVSSKLEENLQRSEKNFPLPERNLQVNLQEKLNVDRGPAKVEEGDSGRITKKIFNKIMYPSPRAQNFSSEDSDASAVDLGVFTSITASGVLSKRPDKWGHVRRSSLVQSEIFVEAYTGDTSTKVIQTNTIAPEARLKESPVCLRDSGHLRETAGVKDAASKRRSLVLEDDSKEDLDSTLTEGRLVDLPPAVGGITGKSSPTKIPSPVHTINRPRSRSSLSSQNLDLSDSSLETESYLRPTQTIISSLQARLSLDSDPDSDLDKNYMTYVALNNEARNLLKTKPVVHVRHNSFDDRTVKTSNKLEHFHNKNFQNKPVHRIHNSPNNSPIRRSSSFSLKNQLDAPPKGLKETNLQHSASTASIKPNLEALRRCSTGSDRSKNFLDSETSSDEDLEKNFMKNKKDLTSTRYNRAFSLRRARLDEPPVSRCPNTPEMRRKFQPAEKTERTVSVDRKSVKGPEVQSRYMNIAKAAKVQQVKAEPPKSAQKPPVKQPPSCKPPIFSRTDTGRFSMRTSKPTSGAAPKPIRRETGKKKSGPRSNSTLSSREVEFQNWKRRKSYDPMKAAAEGKRKAELARKQTQNSTLMSQSYNEASQDGDSSPSHSSSVHRSQSFHGTAALGQLISSEDEDDLTLSGDEGFSPPTPSPCDMSPAKSNLRQIWMERFTSRR